MKLEVVVSLVLPGGVDFSTTFVVVLMLLSVVRATGGTCDGKLVRTTVDKILSEGGRGSVGAGPTFRAQNIPYD